MKITGILLASLLASTASVGQTKMDIELHGGSLIKTKNLQVEDVNQLFELRSGYAFGLDFDIWLTDNLALTLGYTQAKSYATLHQSLENSPILGSMRRPLAEMNDRIMTLGVTKRFYIFPNTSISPNASIYFNPYFFDADDIDYTHSHLNTQTGVLENESHYSYARLNSGEGKIYGALGASLGLRIAQEFQNIGTFSIRASYGIDFNRNIDQTVYNYYTNSLYDTQSSTQISTDINTLSSNETRGRNTFLLEFGFKMPCSILMGKGSGR